MHLIKGAPDRVSVTTNAKALADQLDNDGYFGLGKSGGAGISRSQLFAFAMALGYESGNPAPLVNTYSGGFIREDSFDGRLLALMYCEYLCQLGEDEIDRITEKSNLYKLAEQYANSGMMQLQTWKDSIDSETLLYDMLIRLDELYDRNVAAGV